MDDSTVDGEVCQLCHGLVTKVRVVALSCFYIDRVRGRTINGQRLSYLNFTHQRSHRLAYKLHVICHSVNHFTYRLEDHLYPLYRAANFTPYGTSIVIGNQDYATVYSAEQTFTL